MIVNLLGSIATYINGFGAGDKSNFLFYVIKWIIELVGDLGVGIILFTLCLKLITLPFDIYSRVSTKKNAVKMEMMRPQLEKLQKQYGNNKELYNRKMLEIQKKNGYSAFSACLPSLITIVIFIIVMGAFDSYSKYSSKEIFNDLGRAYGQRIEKYVDDDVIILSEDKTTFDINTENSLKNYTSLFIKSGSEENTYYIINKENFSKESNRLLNKYEVLKDLFTASGDYNYANKSRLGQNSLYSVSFNHFDNYVIINKFSQSEITELINKKLISEITLKGEKEEDNKNLYVINNYEEFYKENERVKDNYIKVKKVEEKDVYYLDYEMVLADSIEVKQTVEEEASKLIGEYTVTMINNDILKEIKEEASKSAKERYQDIRAKSVIFFWIKNIWVADSPFTSAIPSYADLKKSVSVKTLSEEAYNDVTAMLKEDKNTGFGKGNGYFVLIVLSILSMFASTFIMNKTQKTQMEFSSVDGQAASTQKMMLWIMPIMFGIFAFFYSSAFSIYMILSQTFSTLSSLLINFFVERKFKNKIYEQELTKGRKKIIK